MFHEVVDGSGGPASIDGGEADQSDVEGGEEIEATALSAAFESMLIEAAAEVVRDGTGDGPSIDPAIIEAIDDGDAASLTVEEAVSVLAAADGRDADAMVAELRDHLLMGMATAVLDVDTIAASIDADLTGQEVQQVLEGRAAMTLDQLAEVMAVVETRKP
ncbi:hypothetical protein SAMN04488066_10763 [Halorubrum aquaticum]|uniref:Uncharacterized protein n=1 Tax=Halorubrum aquaticum TaxID=387340 RepID=A0A1I3ASX6_9EURY|nr:DUF5791 family protein [Halorubrum aquaticum]SFH52916.1 hypothetical protein SAMN04488066_10763 [Halorubrum aquaticum]